MEARSFYAWANDKIKYVGAVNDDLKGMVKDLEVHLGLLELRHPALAHSIFGI